MLKAVADELGDIFLLLEEGEALEGADPYVAVAEPGQHRRTSRRRLVAAHQLLARFEQSEGLRRVDAQRLEHLGRQHLAHAALQRQPAVAEPAVGGLAGAFGAEIEEAPRAVAQLGEKEAAPVADFRIVAAELVAVIAQRQGLRQVVGKRLEAVEVRFPVCAAQTDFFGPALVEETRDGDREARRLDRVVKVRAKLENPRVREIGLRRRHRAAIGEEQARGKPSMAEWQDRYWNSSDGLRLHYRDYAGPADRPPILCLPGLTRNARDFGPVADRLAGEWRIIAVEFRGRGQSQYDPDPANYVPHTYAADVLKLLDQLGIADAVFFGTSLGGIVTMLMSTTDPERIAGAVLNDIGPVVEEAGVDRLRTYVGKGGTWASWTEAAEAAATRNRIAFPENTPEQWERFARRLASERADGTIQADYDMKIADAFAENKGTPDYDPWSLIHGLADKPVLIVRGETSDLFSVETADRMLDLLPKAELVTIPGIGHAPVLDEIEAQAGIDRLLARVLAEEELSRTSAA